MSDYIDECLGIWSEEYQKSRRDAWTGLKGKDRNGVGKILGQIKQKAKLRGEKLDKEQLKYRFRLWCQQALKIEDNWMNINISPMMLASKSNEYKQQYLHEQNEKKEKTARKKTNPKIYSIQNGEMQDIGNLAKKWDINN